MFRDMRRHKQLISNEEAETILKSCTAGVMAVHGDDDYPYAVPVSYVYHDKHIYIHSANDGHKIDAIKNNAKVSFTVIGEDIIVPDEFTTYFSSVIAFGKARLIEDRDEKMKTLILLSERYSPNIEEKMHKAIKNSFDHLTMIDIEVEHMTGKKATELMKK